METVCPFTYCRCGSKLYEKASMWTLSQDSWYLTLPWTLWCTFSVHFSITNKTTATYDVFINDVILDVCLLIFIHIFPPEHYCTTRTCPLFKYFFNELCLAALVVHATIIQKHLWSLFVAVMVFFLYISRYLTKCQQQHSPFTYLHVATKSDSSFLFICNSKPQTLTAFEHNQWVRSKLVSCCQYLTII